VEHDHLACCHVQVRNDDDRDEDDDRPPICPACGVTMGMTVDDLGRTRYVCLECGYPDEG